VHDALPPGYATRAESADWESAHGLLAESLVAPEWASLVVCVSPAASVVARGREEQAATSAMKNTLDTKKNFVMA
jgi:hypothetical protein